MATASERRKQKARQKHKERRSVAKASRKERVQATKPVKTRLPDAASWPLGEAFLSDNWHTWEATVRGVASRVNDQGTSVFIGITVDLAEAGLTELVVHAGLPDHQVAAYAGSLATDVAMFSAEPSAVIRLLHDGLAMRRELGEADPADLARVLALFADVDPDESPYTYHQGFEDDQEDTVEVKRGVLASILGVFSR